MKKKLLYLFITLQILFIFSNSLAIGSASSASSGNVTRMLLHWIESTGFSISFDLFHFYVRKLAHFSEYAVLGFLSFFLIHKQILPSGKSYPFYLLWVCIPSIDEGIQYFVPDRTCAFRDVCIDMAGFLTGALFAYFMTCIVMDITRRLRASR